MPRTSTKVADGRKPSSKIRSIAFAGDFMRFAPTTDGWRSYQTHNIAWLRELIGTLPLWQEAGIRVAMPNPGPTLERLRRDTSPSSAWADYLDDAEIAWARRYGAADCDDFSSFVDELASHDLVIGFELPAGLKTQLHAKRAAYVSFCIHPIRFLRDLAFGATTNVPALAAMLQALTIDAGVVSAEVRRLRAMFLYSRPAALALPSGLPLLAGQTERDSVLIDGKGFTDWSQHLEALALALEPYPEVVFLEHPFRTDSTPIVELIRSRLGKTVISTNANAYGVVFSPATAAPTLITLASSLGVEADAAGIPTQFLLADPRRKLSVAGVDVAPMAFVGHAVLSSSFWGDVLQGHVPRQKPVGPFELGDHYLRDGLTSWAYRPLRYGLEGLSSRKVLVPAASLTSARQNHLLAAMLPPATDVPKSSEHAVETARVAGIELIVTARPITCGERATIALGTADARQHLREGFSSSEGWGTWSNGLRCAIVYPVSEVAQAAGAQLKFKLPVLLFDALLERAPVLRVSCGDTVVGHALFRPGGPNPIEIEATVPARAPAFRLDLELSRIGRPTTGNDRRWFGIAVSSLTLECTADDAVTAEGATGARFWGVEIPALAEHHASC